MHIAAANPVCVRREEVPSELVEKEKEIYRAQAKETGKPDKVIEKIVEGKLDKFFKDSCLLEQAYVKNPDITITDYLNDTVAKTGESITIRRFARFLLGEEA
jgi:elongation factor Ts